MNDLEDKYAILSSAFVAKGSKNLIYQEDKFNNIILNNLVETNKPLYRGISIKELMKNKFVVGETLCFDRVTSFSEDYELARGFSVEEYGTNCIVVIEGNKSVFNYTQEMGKVLADLMEICKTTNDVERYDYLYDQMKMIYEEKEWMTEKSTKFKIVDIKYRDYFKSESEHTVVTIKRF